jgi:hypothetical protein
MVQVGRFRQPGGAGRVDVKRAVLDGQGRALGRREIGVGQALDLAIDAREIGIGIAMQPDLRRRRRCVRARSPAIRIIPRPR